MTVASRALQSPVGLCDAKGPGRQKSSEDFLWSGISSGRKRMESDSR